MNGGIFIKFINFFQNLQNKEHICEFMTVMYFELPIIVHCIFKLELKSHEVFNFIMIRLLYQRLLILNYAKSSHGTITDSDLLNNIAICLEDSGELIAYTRTKIIHDNLLY